MADKRDYYEVLGVQKTATVDEIKKAYRQLAKKYHPDSNPGDKDAEQKFKEASEAYAILSDSDKRAKYDQFGHSAFDGAGGAGFDFSGMDFSDIFSEFGFGDIFGSFFGGSRGGSRRYSGPMQGQSVRASVQIDFMEAVFGCEKEIALTLKQECKTCHGTGAKSGTSPITCPKCNGTGQVVYTQQSLFGTMRNIATCPDCNGTGKIVKERCTDCNGTGYNTAKTKIKVNIPAGIDQGTAVRMRELGEPGINGGPRGDLLVSVFIKPHPIFERKDFNIYSKVSISYAQAVLGGDILVDTVDGQVKYAIKSGTATGTTVRLKNKGVPVLRGRMSRNGENIPRGDHYITLDVAVPVHISSDAKELLLKYDSLTENSIERAKEAIDNKTKKQSEEASQEINDESHKNNKDKKKKKGKWTDLFK